MILADIDLQGTARDRLVKNARDFLTVKVTIPFGFHYWIILIWLIMRKSLNGL